MFHRRLLFRLARRFAHRELLLRGLNLLFHLGSGFNDFVKATSRRIRVQSSSDVPFRLGIGGNFIGDFGGARNVRFDDGRCRCCSDVESRGQELRRRFPFGLELRQGFFLLPAATVIPRKQASACRG